MADTHFDIPEPIRRIECCIAPTSDGGIYYTGPSEDWSRPGRMWWAVPDGITSFSTWREVTTVYHEGVPGHHLQVGQTAYRSDVLNRWQRTMCWVSGHGEGWALYSERLMDDLGYLDDPGNKLGMLDGQALRAVRVDHRHRHPPRPDDPGRQPVRLPPRRAVDARPRAGVHAPARPARGRGDPLRAGPLPRLARPGAVVQGRRAHLAAGPRRGQAAAGRRLRPQAVPPRGARPRLVWASTRCATPSPGCEAGARLGITGRLATLRAAGIDPEVDRVRRRRGRDHREYDG